MKKSVFLGALAASTVLAGAAFGGTLDDIKARGEMLCGVNPQTAGFGAPDANGVWQGIDADLCKAVAAAVFGDATKVKFVPLTSETRFTALASGEVDMLARNSTWTFSRDNDLKLDFVAVNYYDGQGFMVKKDLGVASAKELDGATVCIQTGTTTELNLADYFKQNGISYTPVTVDGDAEAIQQYLAGTCDTYTTDASGLASARSAFPDPENHIILPEIISKEPLGPVVRHGDSQWGDIVRWSHFVMVIAEEKGVTKANVDEIVASLGNEGSDPELQRMFGQGDNDMGKLAGLDKAFAYNIIKQVGNYGEVFEANVGVNTPIGLARGLNALWTQGGLQYAPPVR